MRLLIDSMILVLALMILVGAVMYRHTTAHQDLALQSVQEGLDEIHEKLEFQTALWQAKEDSVGPHPPQVMPDWFKYGLPANALVNETEDRPWLDIAPLGDYSDQPPDPLALEPGQAQFWYNPALGIVRARVPRQTTDRQTLDLYNRVNGTTLSRLPSDLDPDRAPLALNPNPVTVGQHASPDARTVREIEVLEIIAGPLLDQEAQPEPEPEARPWWDKPKKTAQDKPEPAAEPVKESAKDTSPRKSLLSP